MELQLCNYEISKQLKELGFENDNCMYYSSLDDNVIEFNHEFMAYCPKFNVLRPTQALVCKWFRDVHNLMVTVSNNAFGYYNEVGKADNKMISYYQSQHDTYEQAEEDGILKAIELLKEKNNAE